MMDSHFLKGAFIISRSLFDSQIWQMPPEYIKTWIWIIGKCNHRGEFKKGRQFNRGECLVTLQETQDQMKYKVGYRTKGITKDQAWRVYEWLREAKMVETTKTTLGMFVKVLRYEEYQNLDNYERDDEADNVQTIFKQGSNNINKNEKNVKNEKKIISTSVVALAPTPKSINSSFFENSNEQNELVDQVVAKYGEHLRPFVEAEMSKFVFYWTEKTPSGLKSNWETKKTFEVKKRFMFWLHKATEYMKNTKKTGSLSMPEGL